MSADDREGPECTCDDLSRPCDVHDTDPSLLARRIDAIKGACGDYSVAVDAVVALSEAGLLERDESHTMKELYRYRLLYNAHAARGWAAAGIPVVKSMNHHDGEPVFGAGWFIVTAQLPTGQVSNHYRDEDWDLFAIPEVERPPEWDGHTPAQAEERLLESLGQLAYGPVVGEVVVQALLATADAAEAVINAGDVAEVVAFPPGTTGLREAVGARDALYEDFPGWLRVRAADAAEGWRALSDDVAPAFGEPTHAIGDAVTTLGPGGKLVRSVVEDVTPSPRPEGGWWYLVKGAWRDEKEVLPS